MIFMQMEAMVKVAGSHEYKSAEQQQELRRIVRDSMQKDRQVSEKERDEVSKPLDLFDKLGHFI